MVSNVFLLLWSTRFQSECVKSNKPAVKHRSIRMSCHCVSKRLRTNRNQVSAQVPVRRKWNFQEKQKQHAMGRRTCICSSLTTLAVVGLRVSDDGESKSRSQHSASPIEVDWTTTHGSAVDRSSLSSRTSYFQMRSIDPPTTDHRTAAGGHRDRDLDRSRFFGDEHKHGDAYVLCLQMRPTPSPSIDGCAILD